MCGQLGSIVRRNDGEREIEQSNWMLHGGAGNGPRAMGKSQKIRRSICWMGRAGHMAPFINHSCCEEHVNCEYVSTDENEKGVCSVNVRTIRDIQSGGPDGAVELLVDVQEVGSGGQAYEELLVCA